MKRCLRLTGILLLLGLVFLIMSCEDAFLENLENQVDIAAYSIGDIGPAGGIIFFIDVNNTYSEWTCLEAAPDDQSTSHVWIEGGDAQSTENGNTSTDIGTGSANTDAIIAQTGNTASAAQVCRDYTGGGFTDWFLPSKLELNLMYERKGLIGGFADDCYWSSSETNSNCACAQSFDVSILDYISTKSRYIRVRAVRAF